jgi:hypothetical protein
VAAGHLDPSAVSALASAGAVRFALGEQLLLAFQYAPAPVPPGIDPIYSRGGFIHPLLSPAGDTLTRIQPPDHYHHYGIWNPWTHTEFRGRELDFWNLDRGHGTVVVSGVPATSSGPVFADLDASLAYLMYQDSAVTEGAERLLDEKQHVKVWAGMGEEGPYLIDFSSTQENVTEELFTVKAYRYQGFGFRATADWNDDNTHLLTSGGKNKTDGNGTRARWINVAGPTPSGHAGILFMTHPDNFNFPEQIRIWPTGMNGGKENVFVNFNPAQEQDMPLPPGEPRTFKYRMVVYQGELDPETADRYWQDYAYPPRVVMTATVRQ